MQLVENAEKINKLEDSIQKLLVENQELKNREFLVSRLESELRVKLGDLNQKQGEINSILHDPNDNRQCQVKLSIAEKTITDLNESLSLLSHQNQVLTDLLNS